MEFDDLEPNIGISGFTYFPQGMIGVEQDTTVELSLSLTEDGYSIVYEFLDTLMLDGSAGGSQNIYMWYKDGARLTAESNSTLEVLEKGSYYRQVTNTIVPNLTLTGKETHVNYNDPGRLVDSLVLVQLYNNTDGPNWKNNTNWLKGPVSTWHGIEFDGRVKKINLNDNNLIGHLPTQTETSHILQRGKVIWADSLALKGGNDFHALGAMTHIDIGNNGLFTPDLRID